MRSLGKGREGIFIVKRVKRGCRACWRAMKRREGGGREL